VDERRPRRWGVHVTEQYSAKAAEFTLPKNGRKRRAILTPPAREALLGLPQTGALCFTQLRGGHWTASARLPLGGRP
jgi:hypothetical protein